MTRLAKKPKECKRVCIPMLMSLTDYLAGSDGSPVSWKCCKIAFHKASDEFFPNRLRPWTRHLSAF